MQAEPSSETQTCTQPKKANKHRHTHTWFTLREEEIPIFKEFLVQ